MTDGVAPGIEVLTEVLVKTLCDAVQAARPEIDAARAAAGPPAAEAVVREVLIKAINAIFEALENDHPEDLSHRGVGAD